MSKVIVEEQYLNDIGIALQSKLNTQKKFTPSKMGGGINSISSFYASVNNGDSSKINISINATIGEVS